MSPDEGQEELEEVQAELKKKDEEVSCSPVKHLDHKGLRLRINAMQRFPVVTRSCVICVGYENLLIILPLHYSWLCWDSG